MCLNYVEADLQVRLGLTLMRGRTFRRGNVHQFRVRGHMGVDDVGCRGERSRIARAVHRVRLDEILLRRRRRVGTVVNGRYGARGHAGAAVDALFGVDEEHRRLLELGFVLAWVDAVDRADVDAGGVLGADAGVGDDECHCA